MTNEELLRQSLDSALQTHGENGFFVRSLREQLRSLEHFKKVKPLLGTETFHIGGEGRGKRGPPARGIPGGHVWEPDPESGGTGGSGGGGGKEATGGVRQSSGSSVSALEGNHTRGIP